MKIKPKLIVAGTAVALGVVVIAIGTALANGPATLPASFPTSPASSTADQHGQLAQTSPASNYDRAEPGGESGHDADSTHEDNG